MHDCKSSLCETPHYERDEASYQAAYDSVESIKCPHGMLYECSAWMDREVLAQHLERFHPEENQDPEHYWKIEAEYRFEKGPYWTPYLTRTSYAA